MNERLGDILTSLTQEKDSLRKALGVLAVLTEALKPKGIRPILVGGRALEFYTLGGYATKDIDLVVNGREQAKLILEEMGFLRRPGERHWYHEELDLAIEIPDEFLAGSLEKVVTVEINGMEAFIIGIEDLVVDRLAAAKFWKSQADAQWAAKLLALHAGEIDLEYLKEAAREQQVEDVLTEALRQSEAYINAVKDQGLS
ncbi:hypothetical protein SAMN00808754_0817 [Thermanaeromonas toyohensis ToBE]|uniref:UbiD family decarboxylase n=1 Tax=Thermanaeromonas toyohensis ToBE TaxID=698762 RepID=A0A1W1VJU9_9FIRM|nr:UbiD family decarboxylase [Thermanaeromonas toyohensis]SMB93214.1 hypothetical protein SAMN00808754_0817 [Thermanaeromonas toyohensis ToBE]